jgi:small subunit ribosomal protein S16
MYRVVVTDSRWPRDGKYLESLGWYNPYATELKDQVFIKADRVQHWLANGAQLSECVESLVKQTDPAIIKTLNERRAKQAVKRRQRRAGKAKTGAAKAAPAKAAKAKASKAAK